MLQLRDDEAKILTGSTFISPGGNNVMVFSANLWSKYYLEH